MARGWEAQWITGRSGVISFLPKPPVFAAPMSPHWNRLGHSPLLLFPPEEESTTGMPVWTFLGILIGVLFGVKLTAVVGYFLLLKFRRSEATCRLLVLSWAPPYLEDGLNCDPEESHKLTLTDS